MLLNKNDIVIFRKKHNKEDIPILYYGDWELGRQEALYTKCRVGVNLHILNSIKDLFINYNSIDLWHLKIKSDIPLHKDPIDNIYHYRYNINYKNDYILNIENDSYHLDEGDSVLFRSDISLHGIELLNKKTVEIISTGIFIERT